MFFFADNGLSHNGSNKVGTEKPDSLQSQKKIDLDGSNGINLPDAASSTTTETVSDQTIETLKKVQNSSNGVDQSNTTESTDNHQDDELIRELEQFEGSKRDDDVATSEPKSSTGENGSNLQDTSDLLKDLESDSPCPGPSESESEMTPIDAAGGDLKETKKTSDDVQVDSTTETSNKRKCSSDSFVETTPKRANIDSATEKSKAADVLNTNTQKATSKIDSETEQASMSDVAEAITSTTAVTKTTTSNDVTSDVKSDVKPTPSNEDLVVSSSGNLDTVQVNVESTKDVQKVEVSKNEAVVGKSTEQDVAEVSSNKMNDTTETMEQDFNETLEADRIDKDDEVTTNSTSEKKLPINKSPKKQVESSELDGKTSENVASSQADHVAPSESKPSPMEIGNVLSFI